VHSVLPIGCIEKRIFPQSNVIFRLENIARDNYDKQIATVNVAVARTAAAAAKSDLSYSPVGANVV